MISGTNWDGEEGGDEDVEQEEELGGKITIIKRLVLEIIWGKLGAMKKGTQTSDKKNHLL